MRPLTPAMRGARRGGRLSLVLAVFVILPGESVASDLQDGRPAATLPAPPEQEADEPPRPCAELTEEERRAAERCWTDAERRAAEYERLQREREERERPTRSSFLKWVHLDGLWTATDFSRRSFGLIGTHVAVMEFGRLYVYGPPGVMLVMERSGNTWRARPGLTWGFSVHLTDMGWPGADREVGLYLNLVKMWTAGNLRSGTDTIGLSLTWGQ